MRRLLTQLILAAGLVGSPLLADSDGTNVWYGGGAYDGVDLRSAVTLLYALNLNNAAGATNVTDLNAWLNGSLIATSNGESAVVRVYWGMTNGGILRDSWSHTNDFGSTAEGQTLTTNVSVTPDSIYYYRFYATNEIGEGWACASTIFSTPAPPSFTSDIGAIPVANTSACLHGNLTAGVSAAVYVLWGLNTNSWTGTNSLGTLSQGAFVSPVAGLSPGTLYYYRLYGTNLYGESWSDIVAFTTRVGSVSFAGGSYDGYDQGYLKNHLLNEQQGLILLVN